MPSVSSLSESALIERLKRRSGNPPAWVTLGIGDDAAAIEPARNMLDIVTTDCLIEDVHFRRAWTSARAIGAKAVAVNLSDLAAMGASPRALLLSLALPNDLSIDDFENLVDGVIETATAAGAPLVGGNLARSPGPLVVDVTAIGAVGRRKMLRRSGGRAGDLLFVTGTIGAAAAGLRALETGVDRAAADRSLLECIVRHERPEARTRCGRIVAANRAASACLDLSDGLAAGVRQLAEASRLGAIVNAESLPIHPGARAWADRAGQDATSFALAGGEDYELFFAVPPARRRAFLGAMRRCSGLEATEVGRLSKEAGIWLSRNGSLEAMPEGFQHFAPGSP